MTRTKVMQWMAVAAMGLLLMAGCGKEETVLDLSGNQNQEAGNEAAGDSQAGEDGQKENDVENVSGYVFVYKDVKLYMGMDLKTVYTQLGEAENAQTSASCKYSGDDTCYTYSDFSVTVNLDGEQEIVYAIELSSDLVETAENVAIGADVSEVVKAYGEPAEEGVYRYAKDGMQLMFAVENDVVTGISYIAD